MACFLVRAAPRIAELAVAGAVPDIVDHVLKVETWHPDGTRERIA